MLATWSDSFGTPGTPFAVGRHQLQVIQNNVHLTADAIRRDQQAYQEKVRLLLMENANINNTKRLHSTLSSSNNDNDDNTKDRQTSTPRAKIQRLE